MHPRQDYNMIYSPAYTFVFNDEVTKGVLA